MARRKAKDLANPNRGIGEVGDYDLTGDVRDMDTDDPRRWAPIENGPVYCSPGCGFDCTTIEWKLACERGEILAKAMQKVWPGGSPQWESSVSENLGWHYKARTEDGRIELHENRHEDKVTGYWAGVSSREGGHYTGPGDTPEEAVAQALASARVQLAALEALLDGMPSTTETVRLAR